MTDNFKTIRKNEKVELNAEEEIDIITQIHKYAIRLVADRVYFVRNCQIKPKNVKWNKPKGSYFELAL